MKKVRLLIIEHPLMGAEIYPGMGYDSYPVKEARVLSDTIISQYWMTMFSASGRYGASGAVWAKEIASDSCTLVGKFTGTSLEKRTIPIGSHEEIHDIGICGAMQSWTLLVVPAGDERSQDELLSELGYIQNLDGNYVREYDVKSRDEFYMACEEYYIGENAEEHLPCFMNNNPDYVPGMPMADWLQMKRENNTREYREQIAKKREEIFANLSKKS